MTLVPLWIVLVAPRAGRTLDGARRIASATRRGRRRLRRSVRPDAAVAAPGMRSAIGSGRSGSASVPRASSRARSRCSPASRRARCRSGAREAAAIARGGARGARRDARRRTGASCRCRSTGRTARTSSWPRRPANERRKALVGTYLPAPRWHVRVATFEGDVADRAEEWQMCVSAARETRIRHVRARSASGRVARGKRRRGRPRRPRSPNATGLGVGDGPGEGDFRPPAEAEGADGLDVHVRRHDDRAAAAGRAADRCRPRGRRSGERRALRPRARGLGTQRARGEHARTRSCGFVTGLVFGGLLVAAAVLGVIAWSRGRYAPRLFFATAAVMLVASIADAANGWPAVLASLQTALPLPLQILGVIGIGLVALTVTASLAGLAIGALPHRLANAGELADRDALRLGVAAGLFAAAVSFAAVALRTSGLGRRTARRSRSARMCPFSESPSIPSPASSRDWPCSGACSRSFTSGRQGGRAGARSARSRSPPPGSSARARPPAYMLEAGLSPASCPPPECSSFSSRCCAPT